MGSWFASEHGLLLRIKRARMHILKAEFWLLLLVHFGCFSAVSDLNKISDIIIRKSRSDGRLSHAITWLVTQIHNCC